MTLAGLGFGISLILAALQIAGVISIGWWLVVAPFLAALAVTVVLWIVGLIFGLIVLAITGGK